MCFPAVLAGLGALGGAGATAAGAAAGAATAASAGGLLSTLATVASIGGTLYSAKAASDQAKTQAAILDNQASEEKTLAAVEEQRVSRRFRSQIAQQRAEMAAKGVDLSSPTAVLLGENAAQEMSFAQQEVRSRGSARSAELSGAAQAAQARGRQSLLSGGISAAGSLLNAAPDLWPGLYDRATAP